jgi:hypothetical protein
MIDVSINFGNDVRDKVHAEELVKIPNFPGNKEGGKFCFVTPRMAEIYKERTGNNLPDYVVVDRRFFGIAKIVGSKLHLINDTDQVMLVWQNETGHEVNWA